jgi:AcrR family transcriptional regulator
VSEREKRGTHVLQAVVEVVADHGLDGVSMRTVAAAAGISLAQVQYYFRSKDELLAAAFQHVGAGVEQRAADVDTAGHPRDVLRRLLRLWLPLNEARARDARVWVAFTAASATSAALRTINLAIDHDMRSWFAEFLRRAQLSGHLDAGLDPEVEGALLLALVDGLVLQALACPTLDDGVALVTTSMDVYLARLFINHGRVH